MTGAVAPAVALASGAQMPQLGLGTWPMNDRQAERAVAIAIELGYRSIDTAENYRNEAGVGRGLKVSGVAREELFVTSKFNARWHGVELVKQAWAASVDRLGVEYLDLLLIHWPNPAQDRYVEAWEGLIQLRDDGRVKAIGTSNFKPAHLRRLDAATGVVPEVNQIQLSPFLTRDGTRKYHAEHGIVTESWSPLGGEGVPVLGEPAIGRLAERYGKTPAQIVLRWHLELGLVTVPKSATPARLQENLDIFDFTLSEDEISTISALDRGEDAATDSDNVGH